MASSKQQLLMNEKHSSVSLARKICRIVLFLNVDKAWRGPRDPNQATTTDHTDYTDKKQRPL